MASALDPTAPGRAIAEIARDTNEPNTARRMMELVQTLLKEASLEARDLPGAATGGQSDPSA